MVSRSEFTNWQSCRVILPTERFCLVYKVLLLFLISISCQLKKKKASWNFYIKIQISKFS